MFKIDYTDKNNPIVKKLYDEFLNKVDQYANIKDQVYLTELKDYAQTALNIPYLAESIAQARISLEGSPILEHVTFSYDVPSFSFGENNIQTDKKGMTNMDKLLDGLKYQVNNAYNRQEMQRIMNAFAKDGRMSVSLDYVYTDVKPVLRYTETSIRGLEGSIMNPQKRDNFVISFSGSTIGPHPLTVDVYTLKKLKALITLNEPIKVNSTYLNRVWNIYYLRFTDANFTRSKDLGKGNFVDFTITAHSYEDVKFVESTNLTI